MEPEFIDSANMIEFRRTFDAGKYSSVTPSKVIHQIPSDADLSEAIRAFEDFLRGCGYPLSFNEYLEIATE